MEKCHGSFIVPLEVWGQAAAVWDNQEHLFTVGVKNLLALVYCSTRCWKLLSQF